MPRSSTKPPKASVSPYPPSSPTKRPSQSRKSQTSMAGSSKAPKTKASQEPYRFDFGKYNGKTLLEVPPSYITWCIGEGVAETRPHLQKAIKAYMKSPPVAQVAEIAQTGSQPKQRQSPAQVIAQRERQLKESMGQWLFDECWAVLQATVPTTSSQRSLAEERKQQKRWLDVLESSSTVEFAKQYPPRPPNVETVLPKTSRPCVRLRETLAMCPMVSVGMTDVPMLSDTERRCVEVEYNPLTGEVTGWAWSKEYIKDIKKCLTAIKREFGDSGLEAAVWEVRDSYSSCVGGITCERRGMNEAECYIFHDQSMYWFKSLPKRP